eukprot:gene10926-3000_t
MKKWLECSLLEGSTGCGGSSQCRKACVDGEAMKVEERSGDDHEQRDNESEDTEHLRLLSQEGTIFHVSLKHARMMQTISWMIDDLGIDDEPIPLPCVSDATIKLDHPSYLNSDKNDEYQEVLSPVLPEDQRLLQHVDTKLVLDTISAAQFLSIDALELTASKVMANRICSQQHPSKILNTSKKFTNEEKKTCIRRFPFLLNGCDDIPGNPITFKPTVFAILSLFVFALPYKK